MFHSYEWRPSTRPPAPPCRPPNCRRRFARSRSWKRGHMQCPGRLYQSPVGLGSAGPGSQDSSGGAVLEPREQSLTSFHLPTSYIFCRRPLRPLPTTLMPCGQEWCELQSKPTQDADRVFHDQCGPSGRYRCRRYLSWISCRPAPAAAGHPIQQRCGFKAVWRRPRDDALRLTHQTHLCWSSYAALS